MNILYNKPALLAEYKKILSFKELFSLQLFCVKLRGEAGRSERFGVKLRFKKTSRVVKNRLKKCSLTCRNMGGFSTAVFSAKPFIKADAVKDLKTRIAFRLRLIRKLFEFKGTVIEILSDPSLKNWF